MTNASIYPTLHGLEKDGFVTHRSEIHNGRARKVYEVTPEGRAELHRWLTDPTPQEVTFRDPTLLKVSMLSHEVARAGAAKWLQGAIDRIDEDIVEYERKLSETLEDTGKYKMLAMQYGVDMLRLRREFIVRVIEAGVGDAADASELAAAAGR